MNPIISSLSNKHPMSWELINHRLLHPSDSVRKEMCCHQTLDGLTKHFPKKIKKYHVQSTTHKNDDYQQGNNS